MSRAVRSGRHPLGTVPSGGPITTRVRSAGSASRVLAGRRAVAKGTRAIRAAAAARTYRSPSLPVSGLTRTTVAPARITP
ncbi:hypothetical protein [Streptomyces sp. NBC_00391]|uniref:hypothetical protein n=1 Tax=Streptomyces sp. NBC_00391 TaxID=2903647 RepID=UPI002E220D0A